MFNRQKQESISLQEVKTLLTNSINGNDRNQDGIPDYLQRPELTSFIKSNKDLNQWESDTIQEIEEWIMGLRGYEFNPENQKYMPVSPPTLNEIGIRKLNTHIKTIVNKHSINTALKEEEVHKICQWHTQTLISWFKYNAKKCKISHSDLTPIIAEFDNFAFIVMSHSINGGHANHITNRTKLTGNVGTQPQPFPN